MCTAWNTQHAAAMCCCSPLTIQRGAHAGFRMPRAPGLATNALRSGLGGAPASPKVCNADTGKVVRTAPLPSAARVRVRHGCTSLQSNDRCSNQPGSSTLRQAGLKGTLYKRYCSHGHPSMHGPRCCIHALFIAHYLFFQLDDGCPFPSGYHFLQCHGQPAQALRGGGLRHLVRVEAALKRGASQQAAWPVHAMWALRAVN
jgi:hypothetical protein